MGSSQCYYLEGWSQHSLGGTCGTRTRSLMGVVAGLRCRRALPPPLPRPPLSPPPPPPPGRQGRLSAGKGGGGGAGDRRGGRRGQGTCREGCAVRWPRIM